MLAALDRLLTSRAALGPAILRIAVGLVFLAHAYAKARIFTFAGTEAYFAAHGFPGWTAYPVFAAELLGGLALVVGWHTRAVAAALVPVLVGALKPHVGNGWMFTNPGGGWEYVAVLLAALAALIVGGGGAPAAQRRATVTP
ncbi:MAG: DoxX family protein [Myxococcales bacterium]|nr:DoxX family protein [Myxococcales bacterium]